MGRTRWLSVALAVALALTVAGCGDDGGDEGARRRRTPTRRWSPPRRGSRRSGKQIHELDLVELTEGKKVDDVVAWAAKPAGPPPGRFLGGPAVRDGLSVSTTFEMKAGPRYAVVCIIPDSLGDGAPHITKGMHSPEFQARP